MMKDLPDYGEPVLIWVDDIWRVAIRTHRKGAWEWFDPEIAVSWEPDQVEIWTDLPNPPEGKVYCRCLRDDRCERYDEEKCSVYRYWICEDEK